jgi:hypothetical protein
MNIMEPKISKLEINLENRLKDSQKISVRLNANIIMPKDEKNKKYLVTEIIEMTTDKKLRILSMEVRCPVSYEDEPELTSEQYQERIKTEIFPIIYQKILDVLDYFSDKTTIELPSIPSFPALQ